MRDRCGRGRGSLVDRFSDLGKIQIEVHPAQRLESLQAYPPGGIAFADLQLDGHLVASRRLAQVQEAYQRSAHSGDALCTPGQAPRVGVKYA